MLKRIISACKRSTKQQRMTACLFVLAGGLVAAAAVWPPQEPCQTPEAFYQTSDGNDWSLAINRAIQSFNGSWASWQPASYGGCVRLGFRQYHVTHPVVVDREVDLGGASGGGWFSGSEIECAPGVTPCVQITGRWAHIHDLSIRGQNSYDGTPGTIGLEYRARARVERVYVRKFNGSCVHVTGVTPAEANGWTLEHSKIDNCGIVPGTGSNDGVFIEGHDANSGTMNDVDISTANGACMRDTSFLGNNYTFNQAATCKGGSYICAGANQRCTFVGNYSEADTAGPVVNAPSMWMGGLSGKVVTGTGYVWTDGTISTRVLKMGPYQQMMTVSNQTGAQTTTIGRSLGDTHTYAYPLVNQCERWRVVAATGSICATAGPGGSTMRGACWKCVGIVMP